MPGTLSRADLEVLTAVVRGLMSAQARLTMEAAVRGALPPELEAARAQAEELDEGSRGRRLAYYHELLYEIGILLAESRRPLSMGEVSNALSVPVSTATRIVDWQVRHGYVERLSDPTDRRRVLVALTEGGRALYDSVERFVAGRLERGLRGFSRAERSQLAALLKRLAEGLAKGDT